MFGSWETARAVTYRRLHNIPGDMGTAVTVQAMVFGNMGDDCATGVAFTRNPSTGERAYYGEFLVNAQGEDVVAGIRTPQPLTRVMAAGSGSDGQPMEEVLPEAFAELAAVFDRLEAHYREMQDIEFTTQRGKLYILQTRTGKRTAPAALKIAVDMAAEGLITREEAILRVDPGSLDQLLHPTLDPKAERKIIAKGLPASPGAVSGKVVFSADHAEKMAAAGEAVILVRIETSPDDIHGMHAAKGILTSRGGMTSHAAVVARGMGKACVCGAGDLVISYAEKTVTAKGVRVAEGEVITLDGAEGTVMLGAVPTVDPQLSGDFATLMEWADANRRLKVRTNAETPLDANTARQVRRRGHRPVPHRAHVLPARPHRRHAGDDPGRRRRGPQARRWPRSCRCSGPTSSSCSRSWPACRSPSACSTRRCTSSCRTRRPSWPRSRRPPASTSRSSAGAWPTSRNPTRCSACAAAGWASCSPRSTRCRRAPSSRRRSRSRRDTGRTVVPEVMIPLILAARELQLIKQRIDAVAAEVGKERGGVLEYQVGTMIELPRAALRAGEIAAHAEFFSFGTNDLTQMTLGLSRDDSGKFLEPYIRAEIFHGDPFQTLDISGVGELVELAAERGRAARPDLKLGICGEHGGDPASVAFCEQVGLDYVSCSPYRVPIARLAAAQAALRAKQAH